MERDAMETFKKKMRDLEEVISKGKRVPFSSLVTVDRESALTIIDDLYHALPGALNEAETLVQNQITIMKEANEYADKTRRAADGEAAKVKADLQARTQQTEAQLQQRAQDVATQANQQAAATVREAQEKAARIVADAESQAEQMVSEQEIVARANLQAEDLRQSTQEEIERLYTDVYGHVDEVLIAVDRALSDKLTEIRMMRQQMNQGAQ